MALDRLFGRHRTSMHRVKCRDVEISFSALLEGASDIDFIHESGFVKLVAPLDEVMLSGQTIFEVRARNYYSCASLRRGMVRFERNKIVNELRIGKEFGALIGVAFGWTPTEITCGYALTISTDFHDLDGWFPTQLKKAATQHTIVPASVFQAVLTEGSYEDGRYRSSEDLLRTIVRVLECLERDGHRHASHRVLWREDIPLAEPEVTRFVGTLLPNYGNLLSFQVPTEARAGAGGTDFHVTAYTEQDTMVEIALEGKYAHSRDLHDGLYKQLPAYMRALSADFGIYLIYWMQCERFQEPKQ